MPSLRLQKINSLLEQEIGKIIRQECDLPKEVLVTVTKVDTSPDLCYSKVFVSILPPKLQEKVITKLDAQRVTIQETLGQRLYIKSIPRLNFEPDQDEQKRAHIDQLIRESKDEDRRPPGVQKSS